MNTYGVIMAGGSGTRFWPLSRENNPKQLLNLTGKDLMINETVDRLSYIVENGDIFIVTNAVQQRAIAGATRGRVKEDHILIEPAARNTAACIGYAAAEIVKKYGDGVMVITPSDHFIKDTASFTRVLNKAVRIAETEDKLITVGITPAYPATGFGYIKYGKEGTSSAKQVIEFKEKPDRETAQTYLDSGDYLWNSGMFVWKASVILESFARYAPDIRVALDKITEAVGTDRERAVIERVYPDIKKISIDYAVMEPSASAGDVLVIPAEIGWNDVGSWDMLEILQDSDEHGNVCVGDVIAINTRDSVLFSTKKLVAAVDAEGIVVVETPDAIMVCPKDKVQDVKLIVEELERKKRSEVL